MFNFCCLKSEMEPCCSQNPSRPTWTANYRTKIKRTNRWSSAYEKYWVCPARWPVIVVIPALIARSLQNHYIRKSRYIQSIRMSECRKMHGHPSDANGDGQSGGLAGVVQCSFNYSRHGCSENWLMAAGNKYIRSRDSSELCGRGREGQVPIRTGFHPWLTLHSILRLVRRLLHCSCATICDIILTTDAAARQK